MKQGHDLRRSLKDGGSQNVAIALRTDAATPQGRSSGSKVSNAEAAKWRTS